MDLHPGWTNIQSLKWNYTFLYVLYGWKVVYIVDIIQKKYNYVACVLRSRWRSSTDSSSLKRTPTTFYIFSLNTKILYIRKAQGLGTLFISFVNSKNVIYLKCVQCLFSSSSILAMRCCTSKSTATVLPRERRIPCAPPPQVLGEYIVERIGAKRFREGKAFFLLRYLNRGKEMRNEPLRSISNVAQ